MNKVILGLILAVCLLGMALAMLNERLGRKNEETAGRPVLAEQSIDVPPAAFEAPALPESPETYPARQRENAVELEDRQAEAALAPPASEVPAPVIEEVPPVTAAPAPAEPAVESPAPRPQPPARAVTPKQPESKPAEKPAPKPAAKPESDMTISRFVVYSRENGVTVRIAGPGKLNFQHMTLENPHRVVVDLDGHWTFPENPGIPKNDLVDKIRIAKNGSKTRVVIDLKTKPRLARVIPSKSGDSIDVRVDK